MDFYATGINKLISHWQNGYMIGKMIIMALILIIKNLCEPSYNDLNFMV